MKALDATTKGQTHWKAGMRYISAVLGDVVKSGAVSKLKGIQAKHSCESTAFLSTGQIPFEEMTYLGCLWKFGMGFLHGDANTRQCMATAVTAYKQSFGFDAPPAAYADFEESGVIVLVGANLCIAHPILWQRVIRNQLNPHIIAINPRITEAAQAAIRDYAHLDEQGGIQWPFFESQVSNSKFQIPTERRLFADGKFYTPDRKARLLFSPPADLPEPPEVNQLTHPSFDSHSRQPNYKACAVSIDKR